MTVDLTGGMNPGLEYFLEEKPGIAGMCDSATLWIMDDTGKFAFPRVTFDAIAESWETPWVQINYVQDDGTTVCVWSQEPGRLELDAGGNPATRGAGPLRVECVEPFRRWTMDFDGSGVKSTTTAQMKGLPDGDPVPLSFHFEADMAAPPWLMGGMTKEAAREMKAGDAGALMGGIRYEHLCRVNGTVSVDGRDHVISGTGMRVRRQGVRNVGAAMGHCQHSALFPSGKGFGAIIMAPGPEGPIAFNEAFLFVEDGRQIPARVIDAPWMRRLTEGGDDASLTLESEAGTVRIEGRVLLSLFDLDLFEMSDISVLHQGTARYVWDGEETIGLIERCTLKNRIEEI